jgi:hypothetical protein
VPEARLEDSGSGLAPVTDGWFVVNARDGEWWTSKRQGAWCNFEYEGELEFAQFGINLSVLEPGQSGLDHAESAQEAFLVLSGTCRLLVEGEERLLRSWDFLHSPPGLSTSSWVQGRAVRDPDGRCALACDRPGGVARAVPSVGARSALRRKCRAGDARLERGIRELRAGAARTAAVLASPSLGPLTLPEWTGCEQLGRDEHCRPIHSIEETPARSIDEARRTLKATRDRRKLESAPGPSAAEAKVWRGLLLLLSEL